MKSLTLATLVLGIASTGALAQPDQPATQGSAQSAAPAVDSEDTPTPEIVVEGEVPKEQRRVCEMQTPTGSIMSKRVCRTVAQIEEEQRVARESLEIIKRDRDTRIYSQERMRNADD
jgi:hypothetical protein